MLAKKVLCGFWRDHHPLYDNVTCPHRKTPPVEVAGIKSVKSAIEFNSEVAIKSGIELELATKTTELETKEDDDSYNSDNESLEEYFDNSDMEGEELTLFNNGIVVCKKCAATNQFIDNDADNIDFGNGK